MSIDVLRRELVDLDESIASDERFLDSLLERRPDARGQETADLRERIAEGRMIRRRLVALIERMEAEPWRG